MSTHSLLLRQQKGSNLSVEEMDNNLLYLQQLANRGIGATGFQGPRGFNGANGTNGPQGSNGKTTIFFATSSTYLSVPNIGYVVNMKTEPGLGYSENQYITVYNDLGSFYVDNDYDEGDANSGIFSGIINEYDIISGSISIVTQTSEGVGLTYSFWYLNLTGMPGQDGQSGGSASIPQGSQGSVQYNGNGSFTSSNRLIWDEQKLSILSGVDDVDVIHLGSTDAGKYVYVSVNDSGGSFGYWHGTTGDMYLRGNFTAETPISGDNSTKLATTEYVQTELSNMSSYPLTASFIELYTEEANLNTGVLPFSNTYSTILTGSASLDNAVFNGIYTGDTSATFSVTISYVNSYIPLVESTIIPYEIGEVIQGDVTSATASIIYIFPLGGGHALVTDSQVNFAGNNIITGLSSGAYAYYDSLRASDIFSWSQIGGSQSSGVGICSLAYIWDTTELSNGISVTFPDGLNHTFGDTWVYNINQIFNDPLIVNSSNEETLRVKSDGTISINQINYDFPNVAGTVSSFLENDGAGNLSWGKPSKPDYISVSIANSTGVTQSAPSPLYLNYSKGITLNNTQISLNNDNVPGKLYQIHLSFFVYNINEAVSYRFKLNNTNFGIEINLFQYKNDAYNITCTTEMLAIDTASIFEFWRVTDNTLDPAVQGRINIIEILT